MASVNVRGVRGDSLDSANEISCIVSLNPLSEEDEENINNKVRQLKVGKFEKGERRVGQSKKV